MNKSASSRHSVHIAAIVRREAQIPGHLEVHQLGSHHLGPSIRWSRNVVWNMTSPFLIGKPSIFMGHLYHGYVSHNQRVYIYSCIISGRFPAWMHSARYYCLHDDLGIYTVNIYIYNIYWMWMNGKSTEYVDLRHLCSNHPFAESSYDIVDLGKPIELLWLMRSYSYILAMSLHPYMSNTFKEIKRSNEYFENSLYYVYIYNMHIPCESTVHPVAAFLLLEATPPGDVPPHPAPASRHRSNHVAQQVLVGLFQTRQGLAVATRERKKRLKRRPWPCDEAVDAKPL